MCGRKGCGISLTVVGAILTVVFLLIYFLTPKLVTYEINSIIIVDSPESPNFDRWQNLCDPSLPPLYLTFFFFNLTNYHEVIYEKAIPNFDKVGPYTYLECQYKQDPEFLDDGTKVRYGVNYTFYWSEEHSGANLTESDVIISLNLPAVALYTLTGNETYVGGGAIFAYISAMGHYFTEVFPQLVLNEYWILNIRSNQQDLLPSVDNDNDQFDNVWANYTSAEFVGDLNISKWSGMYLAVYNNDTASDIPADVAANLWNPNYPNSFVNSDYESQVLWIGFDGSLENSVSALQASFPSLTNSQWAIIRAWRLTNKIKYTPELIALINQLDVAQIPENQVKSLSDIGALQWATGGVTGATTNSQSSVHDLAPEDWKSQFSPVTPSKSKEFIEKVLSDATLLVPAYFPPEMWAFENTTGLPTVFTVDAFNQLFTGNSSILGPETFTSYFLCDHLVYGNPTNYFPGQKRGCSRQVLKLYNLSDDQFIQFHKYMHSYVYPNFAPLAFSPVTGAGLIDAQTVYQRLWFGPLGLGEGNQTLRNFNSTFTTGKDDPSQVDLILEWEDQSYLCSYDGPECTFREGFWPVAKSINGSGDGLQWAPGTGEDGEGIIVWDSDIFRSVFLEYNGTVDVQGVLAHRFVVDTWQLDVDPSFDQYIQGFANLSHYSTVETAAIIDLYDAKVLPNFLKFNPETPLVSNETALVPVFLCLPDMYYTDPDISKTVTGLHPEAYVDTIYLTIEPQTGTTIEARKQLQYNVYLDEQYQEIFSVFYKNLTGPYGQVMWPVATINEHGTLNEKTANQLKILLYDSKTLANYSLWVGVPLFILMSLGGVYLIVSSSKGNYNEYDVIN